MNSQIANSPPENPRCRCCGSARVRERGVKPGRRFARDFHYCDCAECSFFFVEPVTDFSIYDDDYYAGRGLDPSVNYREEYENYAGTPRLLEFENFFDIAERHFHQRGAPPAEGKIAWLDFGCGAGGLLKFLRARSGFDWDGQRVGIEITGHDVGSYARRLQQEDQFDVLDLDQMRALPDASFDVITCIEVLEHIPEPRPLIELLARLLRPGGLLILTTGNLACPMARWQGLSFSYLVPEIHISLFNPTLLGSLYRQAGLAPVRVRYDGAVRFRILKILCMSALGRRLAWLVNLPPVVWVADFLYGTSAMPCAVKPAKV